MEFFLYCTIAITLGLVISGIPGLTMRHARIMQTIFIAVALFKLFEEK